MIIPVAVEKLARQEFAEIASRQEALQTIFPRRIDIFYHPFSEVFQKTRVFQQPPLFATSIAIGGDEGHNSNIASYALRLYSGRL